MALIVILPAMSSRKESITRKRVSIPENACRIFYHGAFFCQRNEMRAGEEAQAYNWSVNRLAHMQTPIVVSETDPLGMD
jgi:hypothetical protein